MRQSDGCKNIRVLECCGICGEPKVIRLPENLRRFAKSDPHVPCRCDREKAKREEEARRSFEMKLKRHRFFRDSLMDEKGRKAVFDKLTVTEENRKYIAAAKRYCENWEENLKNNRGLLFYGGPGRGKTTLACCIANALLDKGVEVKAVSVNALIQRVKESYAENANAEAEVKEIVKNAPLLILDDLGAEYKTEWSTSFIYDIIDARYRAGCPMIITTNYPLDKLKAHLSDSNGIARAFDRLTEILAPVEFRMRNYRIEQANSIRHEYDFFAV